MFYEDKEDDWLITSDGLIVGIVRHKTPGYIDMALRVLTMTFRTDSSAASISKNKEVYDKFRELILDTYDMDLDEYDSFSYRDGVVVGVKKDD